MICRGHHRIWSADSFVHLENSSLILDQRLTTHPQPIISMQPTHKAATLQLYALGLLIVGLCSAFYNSKAGVVGWYSDGKTGLIVTAIGASFAMLFSVFAARDKAWAHWSGVVLCFLFLIVGFKNAFLTARGLSTGSNLFPPHLWFKAALFGAIAVLSLITLIPLMVYVRHRNSGN